MRCSKEAARITGQWAETACVTLASFPQWVRNEQLKSSWIRTEIHLGQPPTKSHNQGVETVLPHFGHHGQQPSTLWFFSNPFSKPAMLANSSHNILYHRHWSVSFCLSWQGWKLTTLNHLRWCRGLLQLSIQKVTKPSCTLIKAVHLGGTHIFPGNRKSSWTGKSILTWARKRSS